MWHFQFSISWKCSFCSKVMSNWRILWTILSFFWLYFTNNAPVLQLIPLDRDTIAYTSECLYAQVRPFRSKLSIIWFTTLRWIHDQGPKTFLDNTIFTKEEQKSNLLTISNSFVPHTWIICQTDSTNNSSLVSFPTIPCTYRVSQNKVPPNVWFFLENLVKSYQNLIGYSKAWFISLQRNFEFFNSVQAINIYDNFTKVAQFCLCTRFCWFGN